MSERRFDFRRDPSNGHWIGPDGAHYKSQAEAMYFSLGLCGCGTPDMVHTLLVDCLKAFDRETVGIGPLSGIDRIAEIVRQHPKTAAEFIAHFFAKERLTEHGGSVYGSWITERGKQFLEIGPMEDDE